MKQKFVRVSACISGHFRISCRYYGKDYSCTSTNTLAYDRIKDEGYVPDRTSRFGYTLKQAWKALYDECLRQNTLGFYKYRRF